MSYGACSELTTWATDTDPFLQHSRVAQLVYATVQNCDVKISAANKQQLHTAEWEQLPSIDVDQVNLITFLT